MTLHESDRPAALLARLDAIGRALDASGHGMALLGQLQLLHAQLELA